MSAHHRFCKVDIADHPEKFEKKEPRTISSVTQTDVRRHKSSQFCFIRGVDLHGKLLVLAAKLDDSGDKGDDEEENPGSDAANFMC